MKKLIATIGLSLAFFSAAAMAENSDFQALGNLSVVSVSTMTDKQLAAVEGTNISLGICSVCFNLGNLAQGNTSLFGIGVTQGNLGGISQSIN